jgi:hypothetical protein
MRTTADRHSDSREQTDVITGVAQEIYRRVKIDTIVF